MAHKAKSFKLDQKKKVIVIYTNVEEPAEQQLINYYLNAGFTPMFDEKKATKTVAEMREDLAVDADALKEFNKLYSAKTVKGQKAPFFNACKFYNDWKKGQK